MGNRGTDETPVFDCFNIAESTITKRLAKWINTANITKRITFHCARHTFATLLLTFGTDIYTVSKLLGHRNITTTQVYAKIIDTKKQTAVETIPKL